METSAPQQLQLLKKIDNYIFNLQQKVGQGSFSKVYKGINTDTKMEVAVKKVRVSQVKSKIAKRLLECQVNILRQVNHQNIIKCHDIHFSVNNCYIVTQLCDGGNLYQHLQDKHNRETSQKQIPKVVLAVFQALSYLNQLGIVHRDIKVSNIFIRNGQYKVGDFGFAIRAKSTFRDISIGSPVYMSPQGLIHNIYGPKTDIWAFGILIYEMFHLTTPLEQCKSEDQLRKKVLQPPQISVPMPEDLKQLMLGCLQPIQAKRMSVKDIANSAYILRARKEVEVDRKEEKDLSVTNYSTSNTLSSRIYHP